MREFFVPKIVETDRDHGADGGFDDDGAGDPPGIVMVGGGEKFLGSTISPDAGQQKAGDTEATKSFKG
jgi:hypothetical protein